MKAAGERYTIAVDFDGVIHSYTSPWTKASEIPDPPVPGAFEWLDQIEKHFQVVVFSTRCGQDGGIEAMRKWMLQHGMSPLLLGVLQFAAEKPAALLYIDDRAYRFTGANWPTADEIHRLRPWNKR